MTTGTEGAPVKSTALHWDERVQPGRVHRSLYVDREVFDLEQRRIFGATWIYLAHESEVAEPDSFVVRRIGPRPIIVTRDRDSRLHALINRCTHRGAAVCRAASGTAKYFTCGYHGWTFENNGSCANIPLKNAYGPKFDKSDRDLGRVPYLASYRGFIFGTFNPEKGEQPLTDHLGPAADRMDEWITHNGGDHKLIRVAGAQRFLVNANWKCIYDNACDGYHPEYSHQSLLRMTQDRHGEGKDLDYFAGGIDETPMYTEALGNGHTFLDQRPCMYDGSAFERQRPQPGREVVVETLTREFGEERANEMLETVPGAGMNLSIFPSLLFLGNQFQVVSPLAVDRTDLSWYATARQDVPDSINTIRLRTQEDFPMFGEVDDNANFESCFDGMNVPEMEWVDISRHLNTGVEKTDEAGVVRAPISSDLHMRSYYKEWKRLMSRDPELVVG
jgi:phenylpropionate dioxygenase-like ring-hydroxylating dioxygenase large terminal subunit